MKNTAQVLGILCWTFNPNSKGTNKCKSNIYCLVLKSVKWKGLNDYRFITGSLIGGRRRYCSMQFSVEYAFQKFAMKEMVAGQRKVCYYHTIYSHMMQMAVLNYFLLALFARWLLWRLAPKQSKHCNLHPKGLHHETNNIFTNLFRIAYCNENYIQ